MNHRYFSSAEVPHPDHTTLSGLTHSLTWPDEFSDEAYATTETWYDAVSVVKNVERRGQHEVYSSESKELLVHSQENRHAMQGWVLSAVLSVILLTLVGAIAAVGVHWISEDFGQQIISLVLTATLSALGGAAAWAFRDVGTDSRFSRRK
jgi:hypothetical protein